MAAAELYRRYSVLTLWVCVLVIVWGAYVRATGSGAGCGSHWPLCNGVVLPRTEVQKTLIEFSHRLSSALLLAMVGGLAFWAWRLFPAGSFARRAALFSLASVLLEALIGAFIVLLRLVEHDQSVERVISVALHLANTLFLLAALTCAGAAAGKAGPPAWRWRWHDERGRLWPLGLVLGFVALAGLGAVAALGDTLFPPTSVLAGILLDISGAGHLAERIRILHPMLAVAWTGALAWWLAELWERDPQARRPGQLALGLASLNLILGLCNILLLAPLGLQMLHLFVANALWIVFIRLLFSAASRWQEARISGIPGPS